MNRVASSRQSDFCPIEQHFQKYMGSNLCYPDSPYFVRVILCLCSRRAFSAVSMNFSSSLEESTWISHQDCPPMASVAITAARLRRQAHALWSCLTQICAGYLPDSTPASVS